MSQQIRTGKQPAPATPGPTTKCVYQIPHHADSGSKAQLEVFVTSEADVKKYLADKSIALASVVERFEIFHHEQSQQGEIRRPTKAELESILGTSNTDDAIVKILENGTFATSGKHL